MTIHELKCWPQFFLPVLQDKKLAEFRYNDRGYAVGDVLRLREWQPDDPMSQHPAAHYTGRECLVSVTHIQVGPVGVMPDGYAMLSFDMLRKY